MRVAGHAGRARAAIARDDVEIPLRRMRPGILDIGRCRHRTVPDERGIVDIDAVERQFRSDGRIEHVPAGEFCANDAAGAAMVPARGVVKVRRSTMVPLLLIVGGDSPPRRASGRDQSLLAMPL